MGNTESTSRHHDGSGAFSPSEGGGRSIAGRDPAGFPGSALLDKIPCGSINDTHQEVGAFPPPTSAKSSRTSATPSTARSTLQKFFTQAEMMCVQSPNSVNENADGNRSEFFDDEYEDFANNKHTGKGNKDESSSKKENTPGSSNTPSTKSQQNNAGNNNPASSALLARALVSEVTDNPKTMKPAAMAEREKRLLKAQERAKKAGKEKDGPKPVGAPGGIGQPSVLGSLAHALTGSTDGLGPTEPANGDKGASILPPNSLSENRAQVGSSSDNSLNADMVASKNTISIGLSLSRRHSIGHPDTVTRQTAFDFNELQDRQYKYVSSTDSSGWKAGGGERGGPHSNSSGGGEDMNKGEEGAPASSPGRRHPPAHPNQPGTPAGGSQNYKVAAPDTVHIPIIHIDAESPQAVDLIIAALARGEIFIPHMAILPEALSVNGVSPPDLVVRFGTERNDDLPPDEWPNWCLEFMHNQLFEYFQHMGARWMKRPFSITLARKVRWKTVKHMNRYFAHAERVIDAWREKGPQYLDPQLSYIEGGATPEEVARPHGIYLMRNGVPTNYFAPNFDPPYTTKMTRSLLLNVLGKSWNPKRREWTSEPVPRLVTPTMLMATMCGCADNTAGGFMANEVTLSSADHKAETDRAIATSIPPAAISKSDNSFDTTEDVAPPPQAQPSSRNRQPASARRQARQTKRQQQPLPAEENAIDQEFSGAIAASRVSGVVDTDSALTEAKHRPADEDGLLRAKKEQERQPQIQPLHQKALDPDEAARKSRREFFDPESLPSTAQERIEDLELEKIVNSTQQQRQPTGKKASARKRAPTPERHLERLEEPRQQLQPQASSTDPPDAVATTSSNRNTPSGVASSDIAQPSVTGTNSTIMHMNLSAENFVKRELERRQAREEKKEDPEVIMGGSGAGTLITQDGFLVEGVSQDPKASSESQGDWFEQTNVSAKSSIQTSAAARRRRAKDKASQEEERARQIAMIAKQQQQQLEKKSSDPPSYRHPGSPRKGGAPGSFPNVQRNDSGVSLEYSVDSSIMPGGDSSLFGANSTLIGQHYATDASVATTSSRSSRRIQVSSSAQPSSQSQPSSKLSSLLENQKQPRHGGSVSSGLSLQEEVSTSWENPVPSDEELFAVGWAKAMDPKSGSYYYFTLDRSKIVWDNPLAARQVRSQDSADSESLPAGAAAI